MLLLLLFFMLLLLFFMLLFLLLRFCRLFAVIDVFWISRLANNHFTRGGQTMFSNVVLNKAMGDSVIAKGDMAKSPLNT